MLPDVFCFLVYTCNIHEQNTRTLHLSTYIHIIKYRKKGLSTNIYVLRIHLHTMKTPTKPKTQKTTTNAEGPTMIVVY